MNSYKKSKQTFFNELLKMIDHKIVSISNMIESIEESRDNDTKSSVGDKYETGRTMAHHEMDKFQAQLNNALNQQKELNQLNMEKKYAKVEFGSLVITSRGRYFISIGIGKVEIDKEDCFCISLASPIGKTLHQKVVGEIVEFQGKQMIIEDIV